MKNNPEIEKWDRDFMLLVVNGPGPQIDFWDLLEQATPLIHKTNET